MLSFPHPHPQLFPPQLQQSNKINIMNHNISPLQPLILYLPHKEFNFFCIIYTIQLYINLLPTYYSFIGWLRFIATPSKNLINKGFPWFLILHIFDKKSLKSFKIDKNIANLMIFMMGIRMVITSLQPHKKLSLQQENSCYTFSFAKKV